MFKSHLAFPYFSRTFSCIYIDSCYNIKLERLNVINSPTNGIIIRNGNNEHHNTWTLIQNCRIDKNNKNGIEIGRESKLKIINNVISNNSENGVALGQFEDKENEDKEKHILFIDNIYASREIEISLNAVSKNDKTGIWISAFVEKGKTKVSLPLAEKVLISNNMVTDNGIHGIGCQSRFSSITGNVVSSNGTGGKHQGILVNTMGVTVSGNTVTKSADVGIDLGDCKEVVCSNNHVAESGTIGIEINGCHDAIVTNNVVVFNFTTKRADDSVSAGILVHPNSREDDKKGNGFGRSVNVIVTNNMVRGSEKYNQKYGIKSSNYCKNVNISQNISIGQKAIIENESIVRITKNNIIGE